MKQITAATAFSSSNKCLKKKTPFSSQFILNDGNLSQIKAILKVQVLLIIFKLYFF